MSYSYTILFGSENSISVVKSQLENLLNAQFSIIEEWEYFDMYYTELFGLWMQLCDYRKNTKLLGGEFTQYTYQIQVGWLPKHIDLVDGKPWVRVAIVELARMITRNMKCNSAVMREDVITQRFMVENLAELDK